MRLIERKQEMQTIDASKYTYGRLCVLISKILNGKYNIYISDKHCTGSVLIKNLDKVMFTGKDKPNNIKHITHTKYAGGLKIRTLQKSRDEGLFENFLKESVYKMMRKTHKTQEYIYKNIKIEKNE